MEPIWVSVHIHQAASTTSLVKMGELHCCPSFNCVWHQIMLLCLKMFVDNGCCIPTKCHISMHQILLLEILQQQEVQAALCAERSAHHNNQEGWRNVCNLESAPAVGAALVPDVSN